MPGSLDAITREHRRMWVVRLLQRTPGLVANDGLLADLLDAVGIATSRDLLRTDLAWLAEQGLTELDVRDGVTVARLTERGQDVATGAARVPGVANAPAG